MEEWKAINNYEGLYEVSSYGRVRSLPRSWISGMGLVRTIPLTYKSQSKDKDGYLRVTLCKEGKKARVRTHHLVLNAFIGPCPEGLQCRHLDGDRTNNHTENLKWGTPSENAYDRVKHGRKHGRLGKKHNKKTKQKMREARIKWWNNKRKTEIEESGKTV
jgi:hypothetical protein